MKNTQLDLEKDKLNDTKDWILKEFNLRKKEEEKLNKKISDLKKALKGKYSLDLETANGLYEITNKNLKNFEESYNEPYFARIDFREYRRDKESLYIGKFGLGDNNTGEEVVIDWRSPIADLYYSGTQGNVYYKAPAGIIEGDLSLKRKFLFKNNGLDSIFDEGINEIILKSGLAEGNELIDEFLRINLEQSIGSKLKDVVATIQKEQNEIIRAEKNYPIILQGSAGSGKTTVALHRLAYLLYRYKQKLKGKDILVLAPNKLFLDYISEVLPNLGVDNVNQKTFEEMALLFLKIKGKLYTKDKKLAEILENSNEEKIKYMTNSSKLKGSSLFRQIINRYITILEEKDLDIEDIKVEGYTLISRNDIKKLYTKDMVNIPINKRKDDIKKYLNLKLKQKISSLFDKINFKYEYQVARVKKQMEDSKERREKLIKIYDERDNLKQAVKKNSKKSLDEYFKSWKGIDTQNLYYAMFSEEEIFHEITGDKIPKKLWDFMKEKLDKNIENGIIDSDDLAPMLYLKFKIEGLEENKKFKHLVIDEAQDYSIFQLYVANMITLSKSLTIVGDLGQGIYYYKGINNWKQIIKEVFNGECDYKTLTQSYRSTIEIIKFANKVLEKQNNALKPATPVLRHGEEPKVLKIKDGNEFIEQIDAIVDEILQNGKNSIAIIGKTYEECMKINKILKKKSKYSWSLVKEADKILKLEKIIIPSYLTKGLEFDCSIIFNACSDNYKDEDIDKRLLYVALTRALHYEYILYIEELSQLF